MKKLILFLLTLGGIYNLSIRAQEELEVSPQQLQEARFQLMQRKEQILTEMLGLREGLNGEMVKGTGLLYLTSNTAIRGIFSIFPQANILSLSQQQILQGINSTLGVGLTLFFLRNLYIQLQQRKLIKAHFTEQINEIDAYLHQIALKEQELIETEKKGDAHSILQQLLRSDVSTSAQTSEA